MSAAAAPTRLVPTSEIDLLDEDKPLRGQNYACVSFLSPEDVLLDKNAFLFNRFLGSFADKMNELLHGLSTRFPDEAGLLKTVRETHGYVFDAGELQEQFRHFLGERGQELESEYHAAQGFRPTVRGIKIRGVFDTLKEAQVRAEVLKRMGDKFDIFVCQVGVWCPWAPNPADLSDQQYAETQMNTLMSAYRKNMSLRDEFFAQRKEEKMLDAMREQDVWLKRKADEAAAAASTSGEAPPENPDQV